MLRPGFELQPFTFAVNSNYGGLGDHIARMPALRWILRECPHVTLMIFWHDYFVPLARVLLPEQPGRISHHPVSEFEVRAHGLPFTDFSPKGMYNSLHMDLVEHGYLTLTGHRPTNPEDKKYVRLKPEWRPPHTTGGKPYVVVTPLATSPTRTWPGEEINKTILGLQARGYQVLLLGKTEPLDLGNGNKYGAKPQTDVNRSLADIDLIDQVSLIECLSLLSGATAVLGLDNGLMHLAETVDCPQVWGFTSVPARLRLPEGSRSIGIDADVPCRGCQVETFFVKHDFRGCMYDDYKCLLTMTSEKFLSSFDLLIDSLKKT